MTTVLLLVAAGAALIGDELWSVAHISAWASASGSPDLTATGPPADSAALAGATDPGLVDINSTLPYRGADEAGTGMVLTGNGLILTNNHVIDGSGTITVTDIGNGASYAATVVGYSAVDDVAVLQLKNASGLTTIATGDSSRLVAGNGVVVVGNADGAGGIPSWSGGTITATGQEIVARDEVDNSSETLKGLIKTDARVISGDSGGALVGRGGKVIGMVTAEAVGSATTKSYGYAIPINQALDLVRRIESGQPSSTVHIGATAFLGVETGTSPSGTAGAGIVTVEPGGPAARAGLRPGDTITALGEHPIGSPSALTDLMPLLRAGDSMSVQFVDPSGRGRTTTVLLNRGPPL
jgi:S1-C subfamily serine protease